MMEADMTLNRRAFLLGTGAATLFGLTGAAPVPGFSSTRLSVTVRGSGPDVVLIPGLAGSRDVWNGTIAAVPGYRYHLVQVAGFAGAPAGGNARGAVVAPLVEEIARYIRTAGLRRPALVGHSMGGTLAMMVASRYPAQVGKVMVVDMLPQPAGLLGYSARDAGSLANAFRSVTATQGGRNLVNSLIGMFAGEQGQDRRSDPDVVARATNELASIDLDRDLPRIAVPLTVVYASPDEARRAATERTYRSGYAGKRDAKLVRIDNSGHMIMYDQPTRFGAALKAFLAG